MIARNPVCLVFILALGGCNAGGPAPRAAAAGYATESYTPMNFSLPAGQGCRGDVARFRAIMSNDYATGNVELAIYQRIEAEIGQADHACASGEDARASAMIRAIKAKFGYPA